MEVKSILLEISGVLFIAGFVPYIMAILRHETKPAKASWIIWGVLVYIFLAEMCAEHTVNGQILSAVIGVTIVIGLAMRYGYFGWTRNDKFCLVGSGFGIIIWIIYNNLIVGIMISCMVAFIGFFPTFISAWKDPGREDRLAWTIFWISCVFAVIAVPRWTFTNAAQPVTFFWIGTAMMCVLYFKKRKPNKL